MTHYLTYILLYIAVGQLIVLEIHKDSFKTYAMWTLFWPFTADLTYMGMPIVKDEGVPRNTLLFLNKSTWIAHDTFYANVAVKSKIKAIWHILRHGSVQLTWQVAYNKRDKTLHIHGKKKSWFQ